MATFVALRHPVTILVTDFTNMDNLTNDLHILFVQGAWGAHVILYMVNGTRTVYLFSNFRVLVMSLP